MPQSTYVTYIVTTPEKLWEAMTRPELSRRYFFGRSLESDWTLGSAFILRMADGRADSPTRHFHVFAIAKTWQTSLSA